MFFSNFWLSFEKINFHSKFCPYIVGLMKQISTSLITQIYASVIDFLFFIDFFIFFVIDSLVLPYQRLNLKNFLHYNGFKLLQCNGFNFQTLPFFLCYVVREFYQKTLYSRKITATCHFHRVYQLTLHLKMFGHS